MVIRASGYIPKPSPYVLGYTTSSTLRIFSRNSFIIHIQQIHIHLIPISFKAYQDNQNNPFQIS